MRTAVLLALEVEAGDRTENFEPGLSVAANLDLRRDRLERAKRFIEQVADGPRLGFFTRGAEIPDTEGVVHPQVEFQETGHAPCALLAIVSLQEEDVAAAGGAPVTLALAVLVGMRQRRPDARPEGGIVVGCRRTEAIRELGLFHHGLCRKA